MPTDLRKEVQKVIDEKVKPHLAAHGGDIELVDVKDCIATVKLRGSCMGCPMAKMTLKYGVEKEIKAALPQIKRIEALMG
ncbi:MAG: NifU family protein [Candidatus Aenigmatarchaeota archaeon]